MEMIALKRWNKWNRNEFRVPFEPSELLSECVETLKTLGTLNEWKTKASGKVTT